MERSGCSRSPEYARRRAERLYRLWGAAFVEGAGLAQLAQNLRDLERAEHTLRGLLDSPLYRAVPRGAAVAPTLRVTNILSNDGHYRRVAELWRRTIALGHHRIPSSEERRRRRAEQQRSFESYARLLVFRALHSLGYRAPQDEGPGSATCGLRRLHGPVGVEVAWRDGEALTITVRGDALYIRAELAGLLRLRPVELSRFISALPARTLLLASGHPSELGALPRRDLGSDSRIIPISPWSLDATERVARALGLWLARFALPAFPFSAHVTVPATLTLPAFLEVRGGDVVVARPPRAQDRLEFGRTLMSFREGLRQAELRARAGKRPFDTSPAVAVEALGKLAEDAVAYDAFLSCPVCEQRSVEFEPRLASVGPSTWWGRCRGCDSEMGTRPCRRCGKPYPVLLADGTERPDLTAAHCGRAEPEVLERAYGKDLWAEPCDRGDGQLAFSCTECGECQG